MPLKNDIEASVVPTTLKVTAPFDCCTIPLREVADETKIVWSQPTLL